ncbi:MAG: selenocysteine-specific translation elongation factor [bacterium]|nr:selenocysteine-specific translation elongation factor [bacterium]
MPAQPQRHLVIATAGHIDHGKTSLVRALTGMETDRLAEEQRRGITIELGFAFLGDRVTIIDVPGHERFIKTMVAGVSTVDLGLFVVAADDGVMPQSREHVAILGLLGVPRLLVVLTKTAGLSKDWVDLVEEDVRNALPPVYQDAAFFRCDSINREGIEELRAAILKFSEDLPPRYDSGVFRLPVDRAFSLKGHGTVVTGTILGGCVRDGDQLVIMPQDQEVRVRGLQSHGLNRNELYVGDRAALNVIGADVAEIRRGDWLCEKGIFQPTDLLDVEIQSLPDASPLKNRDRVHLHLGTSEVIGRVILLGVDGMAPGETALAQLVLESKILATRHDRFVIRRYSPLETLGGGRVLDPLPARKRRHDPETLAALDNLATAKDDESALFLRIQSTGTTGLSLSTARGFLGAPSDRLEQLISRLSEGKMIIQIGSSESGRLLILQAFEHVRGSVLAAVAGYHRQHPQLLGIKPAALGSALGKDFFLAVIERAVAELLESDLLLEKGYLRSRSHAIQLDTSTDDLSRRIEALLVTAEFNPPSLDVLRKELNLSEPELSRVLSIMTQQGRVVRMADGTPWALRRAEEAWTIIFRELSSGEAKSMAQLREALNCPRRIAVHLMEYFDGLGLTQRQEDFRLPGVNFREDFSSSPQTGGS